MKQPRPKQPVVKSAAVKPASNPKASSFDLWLDRGLHQMFDDVAKEPIPEELRKLIEDDRTK